MKPSIADRVRQTAKELGTGMEIAERLAAEAEEFMENNPHIPYSEMHQMYVTKAAIEADGRKCE